LVLVWNPIQRIRGSASHQQRDSQLRPAVSPLIGTALNTDIYLVALFNHRLIGMQDGKVTFRSRDYAHQLHSAGQQKVDLPRDPSSELL